MKRVMLAMLLGACTAPVGSTMVVPHDSAATCAGYCQSIGLPLQSVVIMASNVGCVCNAQPTVPTANASAAGGLAALMQQEEARRRQAAAQQQQAASQHH